MKLPAAVFLCCAACVAQTPSSSPTPAATAAASSPNDELAKAVDNLKWRLALGDVADVDEITYTSLPSHYNPNPAGQGAGNPLIIHSITFIPKNLDRTKKHPLILLAHGGVHSNFETTYIHIVRELVGQGYSVIATDYRGSTGYGRGFYDEIDYGGREVDDVFEGRKWMLSNYSFLDPARVGVIGWSHGGLITLMNIFQHPDAFAVAYAGVPVSDLVARMGYKSAGYQAIFSAKNHIGKTAAEDVKEYQRRSPLFHVKKLGTPLLVHTNTNDEDVNVLEVERLIAALKSEGKKFEYKIYQDAPGGHQFNRIDTDLAKQSRAEVYKFLASYLKP
jgi:dipeptidyl aminopeptidase/acylaminoacyl peptidase